MRRPTPYERNRTVQGRSAGVPPASGDAGIAPTLFYWSCQDPECLLIWLMLDLSIACASRCANWTSVSEIIPRQLFTIAWTCSAETAGLAEAASPSNNLNCPSTSPGRWAVVCVGDSFTGF